MYEGLDVETRPLCCGPQVVPCGPMKVNGYCEDAPRYVQLVLFLRLANEVSEDFGCYIGGALRLSRHPKRSDIAEVKLHGIDESVAMHLRVSVDAVLCFPSDRDIAVSGIPYDGRIWLVAVQ